MLDLGKVEHRKRLWRAIAYSRRKLRLFRTTRVELVKQYVGHNYGEQEALYKTYTNLMLQTADIYTLMLAANRPQVLVNAKKKEYWPFAQNFQVAVNNFIAQIHLERTLRQAVLDAFFGLGLVKVSRGDFAQLELDEFPVIDPGYPFADPISFDNWCHDMLATCWERVTFEADSYRVPLESVQQDERFEKRLTKDLVATTKYPSGEDGDERVANIARGLETDQDEIEPMVDLIDVWLPESRQIATFVAENYGMWNSTKEPLAVLDWDEPEEGPYQKLSFIDVPDNTMPISIANQLDPLHRLSNSLLRKLARQAQAQKIIPFFEPGAEDDAARLDKAEDRRWTKVKGKDSVGTLIMNGADPGNQAFLQSCFGIFNTAAGNPAVLAGLGPQSPTATQDTMIHEAAGQRVSKMQMRTAEFAANICKHLGYHMWVDQQLQVPGEMEIPGTDIRVPADWQPASLGTPEEPTRQGKFLDYEFDVIPYSMTYQSPTQQVQGMIATLTQVAIPLMATPQAQQAGMSIDVQEVMADIALMNNWPRLNKWVKFGAPPPESQETMDQTKPANTTRTVVRRSAPGGDSPQMQMQELMTQARQQGFSQPQIQ